MREGRAKDGNGNESYGSSTGAAPWQRDIARRVLVFEGEIASVRSVHRPDLVVSAAAVASSSAQAMQARRHPHLTGGGAHGWRTCNRLCTLGGLVWVMLLDVNGSGRRRGTLRYTYRHQYSLQVQELTAWPGGKQKGSTM